MSNEMKASKAKVKLIGIVFDGDTGMPKIHDPRTIPDHMWKRLTQKQKNFANNSVMEHMRRYD